MARDHARLLVAVWEDPDWLKLNQAQQMTYLTLLSSPDLSWCGVAPLLPQRIARLSTGTTERKIKAAITGLASSPSRFLVVDDDTAEVLVRSYVRHDGILKQPNVTKAMVKALDKVHSETLQGVVLDELAREYREHPPTAKANHGWNTIRDEFPELFAKVSRNPSANPSPNPLRRAS